MNKLKKFKGYTLIEVVLAGALLFIALSLMYNIVSTSQLFYDKTRKRADIQSQMRVIMLGLKEEFRTASNNSFRLLKKSDLDEVKLKLNSSNDLRMYYYENGKLYKQDTQTGPPITAFIDFNIPDFTLEFEMVVNEISGVLNYVNNNSKLVKVSLKSGDIELISDFALLNANAWWYQDWTDILSSSPAPDGPIPQKAIDSKDKFIGVVLAPQN